MKSLRPLFCATSLHLFVLGGCIGMSGCASPGTPRAPSLHLPEPVRDLAVERFGDHVELRWTVPTQTTDHEALEGRRRSAGPLQAEVCRAETPAGHCDVVARLPVSAGQVATTTNRLPPALLSGLLRPVMYRVRLLNGSGRAAEGAKEAVAAAGEAPADVTGLAASTVARGVQLTWRNAPVMPGERLLVRVGAQAIGSPAKSAEGKARTLNVPLRGGTGTDADPGGTVDPVPRVGERVRYTVVRSVTTTLQGQSVVVNGGAATITATRERDTFAPAVPGGLVALAVQLEGTPPEIDLSWEPDTESDLLGYYVYRASAATGQLQRLTATPVPGISYRDLQVTAGARYRYAVSAVDHAGNESGHSGVAEEGLRP